MTVEDMQSEIDRLSKELEVTKALLEKTQHDNLSLKQHEKMLCNSIKMLVDLPRTGGLNE